ncbi:hypothetical protein HanXRQr2_Chr09g0406691 [Helianthus annuus]|uniref:Uncharacterized protein n=1 Tax=Helianthus annuus TaxID=4232 RepID=A0A9K3I8M8_HELAN|nr:hypothetical protein HanXRQr2_Chr09g0406691 [Helianthus annuus]
MDSVVLAVGDSGTEDLGEMDGGGGGGGGDGVWVGLGGDRACVSGLSGGERGGVPGSAVRMVCLAG